MSWYRSRHIGSGGGSGGGATPITPSNSSPVSLVGGETYEPTTNGYAISSYNSITPANASPPSLSSGSIYKTGDSGYAIKSYSSITPSNSSPASLSSGSMYKPSSGGYAVSSYSSITPSNSSPPYLSSSSIYKTGGSGYAIQSYTSATPSSSPSSVSSGSFYKMGGSGYVVNDYTSTSGNSTGRELYTRRLYYLSDNGILYSELGSHNFHTRMVLWSSSSEYGSSSFAAQTVYCYPEITAFDFLKIEFATQGGYINSAYCDVIIPVSDFTNYTSSLGSTTKQYPCLCAANSSNFWYRIVYYSSSNYVGFTACKNKSNSNANGYCVPIKITGLSIGNVEYLLEEELLEEELLEP